MKDHQVHSEHGGHSHKAGHIDYWVSGHLHHPHGGHCDMHGALSGS